MSETQLTPEAIRDRDWETTSHKELVDLAREISDTIFKTIHEDKGIKAKQMLYLPENPQYFHFTGEHYIHNGTVTPDMLHRLQAGGKMLSVGVGHGDLEFFLSDGFQIPKERITIADIQLADEVRDKGFPSYAFNMFDEWPTMKEPYDYIFFPESLGVALSSKYRGNEILSDRFYDILTPVQEAVLNGDFLSPDIGFFIDVVEQDIPRVVSVLYVIEEAIKKLNPGGEVRVSFGIQSVQIGTYLILKLREKYPGISFPDYTGGPNIQIKLP